MSKIIAMQDKNQEKKTLYNNAGHYILVTEIVEHISKEEALAFITECLGATTEVDNEIN